MSDTIEDKIAAIIMDCYDHHGLRAYEAAERILALPEVRFVRATPPKPNLGHSIKVR